MPKYMFSGKYITKQFRKGSKCPYWPINRCDCVTDEISSSEHFQIADKFCSRFVEYCKSPLSFTDTYPEIVVEVFHGRVIKD